MKKVALLTGIVVLTAVVTAYSVEENRPGGWWEKSRASAKLDLKAEQVAALDKASFDHRTKEIELRASLKQKRNEVRYLLDQEKMDKKAVLKASEDLAKIENDMRANRIDRKLAMCGVLSPLQQEKLDEMRSRRPGKAGEKGPRMKAHSRRERGKKSFKSDGAGRWLEDPQIVGDLGLTEEQETQLRDSFYRLGQERIGLAAQKEIKEMTLKRVMDASEIDRPEIDGLLGGIGEIGTALARNRAESMISEREILNTEQLDKLRAIKIEKVKERGEFMREHAFGRKGDRKRGDEKTRGPRRSECPEDEA